MENVIILGGGHDQVELLKKINERGFHSLLVDYLDDPPAAGFAGEHLQLSTADKDAVRKLAEERSVKAILCTASDLSLRTAATVSEQLGLATTLTGKQVAILTNKVAMKQIFQDNNILASKFEVIDNIDVDVPADARFPLIVKPAQNTGSTGVKLVEDEEQFKDAVQNAIEVSGNGKAIVEEYVDGKELSVDCFLKDGEAEIIMISQLFNLQTGEGTFPISQSIAPVSVDQEIRSKLDDILTEIISSFGIKNGPLLLQLKVSGDQIYLGEITGRIGGGQKHVTIKKVTGFDILDAYLDLLLGGSHTSPKKHPDKMYSRLHLYCRTGTFQGYTIDPKILESDFLEDFKIYKRKGDQVSSPKSNRDRVGTFMVSGKSREDVGKSLLKVINNLHITGINGEDLLIRSNNVS